MRSSDPGKFVQRTFFVNRASFNGKRHFRSRNATRASRHVLTGGKTPIADDKAARWFSYVIRQERRRINLTQAELSDVLTFGVSALSTIENGHAFSNVERTLLIARRLRLNIATVAAAVNLQLMLHGRYQKTFGETDGDRGHARAEMTQKPPQYHLYIAERPPDTPRGRLEP